MVDWLEKSVEKASELYFHKKHCCTFSRLLSFLSFPLNLFCTQTSEKEARSRSWVCWVPCSLRHNSSSRVCSAPPLMLMVRRLAASLAYSTTHAIFRTERIPAHPDGQGRDKLRCEHPRRPCRAPYPLKLRESRITI